MSPGRECGRCGTIHGGAVCPKLMSGGLFSEAETTRLKTGDRIGGFEILELIGAGGMGLVYKARQPSLERVVALKVLRPERAFLPRFEDRFQREAKVLASLSHPNIVTIHHFGQEGERYFVVLEFVEGTTLRELLPEKGLPPRQAMRTLLQICEALHFAHEKGVIHRDIKPENVLIDPSGRVKITDFGLAKLLGPSPKELMLTGSDARLGTVHYMAPEQVESAREVDRRADLYSLGVMAYEMFTGGLPIGKFERPSKKSTVGPKADAVLLKALEKDPARRYATVAAFRDDLVRAMTGPKTARRREAPTSETVDAAKSRARFPILPIAGAAVLLGLAGVLLLLQPWRKKTPPAAAREEGVRPAPSLEETLRALLPDAAAIDGRAWSKILENPERMPLPEEAADQSLTYVLLYKGEDVSFLSTRFEDRRAQIERPGRISILQPEFLKKVTVRGESDRATGTVEFECSAYRGRVEFEAARRDGWRIVEFRCPKSGALTARNESGGWRASGLSAFRPFEPLHALQGHTGRVFSLEIVGGRFLASASEDELVRIWELSAGVERQRLGKHTGAVNVVTRTPDGKQLVTGGQDGMLRWWEVEGWKFLEEKQADESITDIDFSPDGSRMVSSCENTITMWDLKRKVPLWNRPAPALNAVAFSVDGKTVATGALSETKDCVRLWNAETGEPQPGFEMDGGCADLAFTPDGRHLITSGVAVRRWDYRSREKVGAYAGHPEGAASVAVGPDGRLLVTGGVDGAIRVFDLEKGELLQEFRAHEKNVIALKLWQDGRRLASAGEDRVVRVWATK